MEHGTNGVARDSAEATARYPSFGGPRNFEALVQRMIDATPEEDKLFHMLHGVLAGQQLFGCPETASIAWQSVTAVLVQRMHMWGETVAPEWFGKVAAMFRGDA